MVGGDTVKSFKAKCHDLLNFWLRSRQEAPEAVCAGGEAEKFAANELKNEGRRIFVLRKN